MSVVPSQAWNSSVKVINNNKHEITVYAQVVDFAAEGESGEGKFLPILEPTAESGTTLAQWITLSKEPILIAPEQSYSIPFTVQVPEDAAPGGHFAAILIGTKPPEGEGSFRVSTSQIVTSLFFVRIAGDVIEDGVVREFTVRNSFTDIPKAEFEVRFENKGNVHLKPQGEILITNMWGKERGVIPINQQTHFGNVLPQSIRKFEFSWEGEHSFSDIGRYKALLTLAYGEDNRKFETTTEYFYVIPVKATGIVLGTFVAFVLFVRWSIKAYVRRMLLLAGVEPDAGTYARQRRKSFEKEGDVRIVKASMRAPVRRGVSDFKGRLQSTDAFLGKVTAFFGFVMSYKLFFISVIVLLLGAAASTVFIMQVTEEQRDYEIVISNADTDVKISSEEIMHDAKEKSVEVPPLEQTETNETTQAYSIVLVNSSDTPGAAGHLQTALEQKGYVIDELKSDFEKSKETSVVVYDIEYQEEALLLGKEVGNALLSVNPSTDATSPSITIYIGNDYNFQ